MQSSNRTGVKAGIRTVRQTNRALLLQLIRLEGALTRSDLARRSALAKPTVSAIVESLIEEDIICEIGPGSSSMRGGPRGVLLDLNPEAASFAGIHLTVGHTSVAIADACGRIRTTVTTESYREDVARAVRELPGLIERMLSEAALPRARLRGVGVAVPGLVDHRTGECVLAPNLGWRQVSLKTMFEEALKVPVVVRNSVQAGAIAEARLGRSASAKSFAWIYVGIGIGAAIVIDGRVVYGKRGYTGELGHWQMVHDGSLCECGRRGCLETAASGRAIEAAFRDLSGAVRGRESSAARVASAATEGDAKAVLVLTRAGEYLGLAISCLVNLLDLEVVVLDGPVIRAGDHLVEAIRASVRNHALEGTDVRIEKSTVSDDVILKGALILARDGGLEQAPAESSGAMRLV